MRYMGMRLSLELNRCLRQSLTYKRLGNTGLNGVSRNLVLTLLHRFLVHLFDSIFKNVTLFRVRKGFQLLSFLIAIRGIKRCAIDTWTAQWRLQVDLSLVGFYKVFKLLFHWYFMLRVYVFTHFLNSVLLLVMRHLGI